MDQVICSLLKQILLVSTIISLLIIGNECVSCKFSASGKDLDLTTLSGTEVQSSYKQWTFILSMCSNGLQCSDNWAMAAQYNDGPCTSYIAKWDASVTPTYSSTKGGTWQFYYTNGATGTGCDDGRKLYVSFICSSSSAAYDATSTTIEETSTKCTYDWKVYTQYACVSGAGSSGLESGEMSPGSWMILLVVIFLVLYCIVGYAWNTKKHPEQDWKDFKENTPHLGFWCLIPKLTWAGCCASKDWTADKYHTYRGGGGGDAELIGSTEEDDI